MPIMEQNRSFGFDNRNEGQEAIKATAYEAQNKSNLSNFTSTFAKGDTSGKPM
jgi:hypothetical protein